MDESRLPPELRPQDTREVEEKKNGTFMTIRVAYSIFGVLFYVLYGIGAYRISYNTNGSVLLSVLAFIFAPFYYLYYGLFVSQPAQQTSIVGGRGRRHK
jgi:hypothetical protein